MNEKDEFDQVLFNYYKGYNLTPPKELSENILSTIDKLYAKPTISEIIKKVIIIIIELLILGGGVVLAVKIVEKVQFRMSKGIDSAIENGYIEQIPENISEAKDCKISIDTILMDNYNISFVSNVSIKEATSNISNVYFKNIIIADENKNVLYCDNKETFYTYCNKNNLNYEYRISSPNNYLSGANFFTNANKENSTINVIYNIYNNVSYPRSKKINISFDKVIVQEVEHNTEINGKWNFEIELPEKFYNRESIIYKPINNTNSKLQVQEVTVYNTGTKFEFVTWEDAWYNEDDSEEIKNEKIDKFFEWIHEKMSEVAKTGDSSEIDLVTDIYIENENKERFYPSESSPEDSTILREPNGKVQYSQTFNLTKQNATNKLTIYFKYKGEQVVIDLSNK